MFKTKYFLGLIKPAVLIWLVPFIVSIFFFNQEGELAINFWLFKIIMLVVGFSTGYFVLKKHYIKNKYPWLASSIILVLYNVLIDLVVIVGFLGEDIATYFVTIATVYIIFIPLSNYLVLSKPNSKS
ncbi:MAG: hypothetical protein HC932_04200 [Thermales bacterium]|nr:hypothetical protein [Thermales bacterium]